MNNPFVQLALVVGGLTFTILVFRYLFSSASPTTNKTFTAIDGTLFSDQKECQEYNFLFEKLGFLFDKEFFAGNKSKKDLLGMKPLFIQTIKESGFKDLKILISFKDDFKIFSELLNTASVAEVTMNQ